MENNIDAANPVDTITENSGLSARTFKRRFTQATGFTPIHYMQKCRIEAAKQKLERTDLPIDEIAWQVGYRDPAFFRRLFKRLNGVTAGAHRRNLQMPRINPGDFNIPRAG
ncbi:MAG TPA: helix-turn-helix domain-containing protein [Gammaproteobacteria bacterium]|nr:helix-turn-helix domain-containing protein [Gammaproteobacteria bacterium]